MSLATNLKRYVKEVNSMLKFTSKTLHDIGTYINADQPNTRMAVGEVTSFSLNIPEDGCYVVTLTNEWGIDAETLFTILYLEYNGDIIAFSRNSMRAGGGQSVTAIIQATKGSSVQAKMSWHGGSGECEASRIKFRAVRIGGGNSLTYLFLPTRLLVRIC